MASDETTSPAPEAIDLSEEDILSAMQEIPGYLDITPADFREIYLLAYRRTLARLSREMTAADIMTREVAAVLPETPLPEVAAAMGAKGISGVPVVDGNGKVTGVISEKDFLRRMGVGDNGNFMTLVANCLATKGCVVLPVKNQQAKDLMTSPAVVIFPRMTVQEISKLFQTRKINRAPVVDEADRLVGIVSRADLMKTFSRGEPPC